MSPSFKRSLFEDQDRPLLRGWLGRTYRFFTEDLWRRDHEPLTLLRRTLRRAGRLSFLTLNGFVSDRCVMRASALTYVTVLSLVPLLALSFVALKGMGLYEELKRQVITPALDNFLPNTVVTPGVEEPSQLRATVERVLGLVETTDFRAMTAIGLVVVLWAVLRLLGTVEASFNDIWGVRRSRSLVRKITDYLAIVIVAPIFLVVAVGLTSTAQATSLGTFLGESLKVQLLIDALVRFMPLLAGWVAFTFVYMALPNTRTKLSSAALGGFVAGTAWQVALLAHVEFQVGVANYNKIYSTFAAIPIFLVWVQVSWVIVLFGAELAFAHQHEREYRRVVGWRTATPAMQAAVVLRVLARIVAAFQAGRSPLSAEAMAEELGVPPQPVDELLEALAARGVVAAAGEEEADVWLLARDPGGVRVADVLEALEGGDGKLALVARTGVDRAVDRLLESLELERRGSAYNLSLRELAERGAELDAAVETGLVGQPSAQPS